MAIQKIRLGTTDDGKPLYHFHSDGHIVLTGPITGNVTTEDGTTYNVTEPVIEVAENHRDEVAELIGQRYADEGHPDHTDDTPFVLSTGA